MRLLISCMYIVFFFLAILISPGLENIMETRMASSKVLLLNERYMRRPVETRTVLLGHGPCMDRQMHAHSPSSGILREAKKTIDGSRKREMDVRQYFELLYGNQSPSGIFHNAVEDDK